VSASGPRPRAARRRRAESLSLAHEAELTARFLVQRADCEHVAPADDIDPAYGESLRRAAAEGAELFALGARVTARAITVERELPVCP